MGAHVQHLLGRCLLNCTRAFLPMLQNAEEGAHRQHQQHQRFLGVGRPTIPHTAYSAAKFAVKGFTEALIADLRINAPHIKVSVVMPGQIGTCIRANSRKMQTGNEFRRTGCCGRSRRRGSVLLCWAATSRSYRSGDQCASSAELERRFRDEGLTSAAQAATIILDGVKAQAGAFSWVDAQKIDEMVRQDPRPRL